MAQSTITSKYQTTVPKEVRQKLELGPQDVLLWEVTGKGARVSVARSSFLERRGSIHIGAGSTVDDIRKARLERGLDGR